MQISLNITQAQTQSLVMTQEMHQVIEMMQLSQEELEARLEVELSENPALVPELEGRDLEVDAQEKDEKKDDLEDIDWDKLIENSREGFERSFSSSSIWDDLPPIEQNYSPDETLSEHLLEQLGVSYGPDDELYAAEIIIHNLNEKGYLDCTYEEVMELAGCDLDAVEGAIILVREFEPIGCGARNLKECLCFQAILLYPQDPYFVPLLESQFERFIPMHFAEIAESMDMDIEDVEEYFNMVRAEFESEPGRPFNSHRTTHIRPDIEIAKQNDEWVVISTDNGNPKLRLSAMYEQLKKQNGGGKDTEFLDKAMKQARFLVENIYRRENTLKLIVESILQFQLGFFEFGREFQRPLVLRDVAEDTGLHESTVSRLTSKKYALTSKGMLELKSLFSPGLTTIHGGVISTEAVKVKIDRMVREELKIKPLSDSAISKRLLDDGIKIARRTISKYREELRIPSSQERRRR